jgi:hypothetical protein
MKNNETFTDAQLKTLADAFKNIETINPESPHYRRMRELIAKLSDAQLKTLASHNVKFVTALCRSEIILRRQASQPDKAIAKLAEIFGQGAPVTEPVDPIDTGREGSGVETFRAQRNADMGDAVRAHLGMGGPAVIPAKGKPTPADLEQFCRKLEDFMISHHTKSYSSARNEKMVLETGRKYARIFRRGPGVNSCYCFISLETGEIFKPATWSAPAKHARGTIFQSDAELFGDGKVCGPYGIIYLR